MFGDDLRRKRLVQPFAVEVDLGASWRTALRSRRPPPAMQAFRTGLLAEIAGTG